MSNQTLAIQRLTKEKQKMDNDPNPNFIAIPSPSNLFEWHFVLYNFAADSPFQGGQYHGQILVPVDYPLKPPSLIFQTPQGRFKVGEKICLSFTNYHPESWSTSWTIATMLIGLISFMHTEEKTVGGVESHISQKKIFAQKSIQHNLNNPKFVEMFQNYFSRLGIQNQEQIIIVENDVQQQLLRQPNQNNKRLLAIVGGVLIFITLVTILYFI